MLKVLDLFSGIGGFSLGIESTGGFETVAFCECEPYPRRVLAKHWPGVPIYDDVRTLTADTLRRDGIAVDVICGGFPCQDVSFAGKRAGLEGERSGLWEEYRRIIGEVRPMFVAIENVPGLLNLGMATILGDLAALGYDATWDCIPASAVGAPHRRDRVWIVAYAYSERVRQQQIGESRSGSAALAQPDGFGDSTSNKYRKADRVGSGSEIRDANVSGLALREGQSRDVGTELQTSIGADRRQSQPLMGVLADGLPDWLDEPADIPRVAQKVENRVARLKALGNAVVPQIPAMIGRAILGAIDQ